ncbi:ABC transporter substrate-binding protein [Salinisphaera sp.]|uniref:ABC transporter substrate-binding protein n=1 Tax=Salinisphaera sp. TaxID=1914330 RepID=UPI002D79B744|nr:ABC transporter substrate-binding protein [Salinisphaera sp.]HET7314026.1 ABC transporter substrate-binding protein [Salinisphaera sp.]
MFVFKGWTRSVGISALTLALWMVSTGGALAAPTVKFAAPPWPGVTVKTAMAQRILEAAGYDTHVTNASWTIALQGVARGDIDADLGIWMPTQKSTVEPMVKSGKIDLLVKNVPDAQYDLVVPDYVWNAGVHSIADLNKYADKFDHRIYGIEAGNDGNQVMIDAIKNDTYNLGDWTLRPSSTAVMLTAAGRKIDDKEWIVFLGWKPHWMNIKYDLKYLKDPKQIWGGGSVVYTAVNPTFEKKNPNVIRFLKQMVVSSDIQSDWVYDYGYKHESADEVVDRWIKNNMDMVAQWLDGVKTADGSGPALAAVKKELGG